VKLLRFGVPAALFISSSVHAIAAHAYLQLGEIHAAVGCALLVPTSGLVAIAAYLFFGVVE
jgi:hypothetical protein